MRNLIIAATCALALAGCSNTRLQQFQTGVSNFVAGVQTVNAAIRQVSAELAKNCDDLHATASALADVTSGTKAGPGLAAANSAIVTWCQSPPTSISTAIRATAAQIVAAKAAYSAAKAGG